MNKEQGTTTRGQINCRWGRKTSSKRGPPKFSKYKTTWVALDFLCFSCILRKKLADGRTDSWLYELVFSVFPMSLSATRASIGILNEP